MVHDQSGLSKTVWSSADYEQMGWHDAQVHGMAFVTSDGDDANHSFLLDLDYIVAWVDAEPPDTHYTFWIAPVTLAFDNAWDVRLTGAIEQMDMPEVLDLHHVREFTNAQGHRLDEWHLEGDGFDVKVRASDFKQYFRREPIRTPSQRLSVAERGTPSFDRQGFDGSA